MAHEAVDVGQRVLYSNASYAEEAIITRKFSRDDRPIKIEFRDGTWLWCSLTCLEPIDPTPEQAQRWALWRMKN